jgi:hypothetical protein
MVITNLVFLQLAHPENPFGQLVPEMEDRDSEYQSSHITALTFNKPSLPWYLNIDVSQGVADTEPLSKSMKIFLGRHSDQHE